MNNENELYELLDAKRELTEVEIGRVIQLTEEDPILKTKVEEHQYFVSKMKAYGAHFALKASLEQIHEEMDQDPLLVGTFTQQSFLGRNWPVLAVAASVAAISIIGTLLVTQSLAEKQTAIYKELRGDFEQIKKSNQRIREEIAVSKQEKNLFPGRYRGTGFLVAPSGYIATSYHVIREADSVYIQNDKFGPLKTVIVYSDPQSDIALLKITDDAFKSVNMLPYQINGEEASLSESVFTLGFPREDIVFGEGSVSALTGFKQNQNAYQVSVPVNPGNSGGPLMNERGDVIGMISGLQTETAGAAFAVKSNMLLDVIKSMPDSLSSSIQMSHQNSMKNLSQIQRVKKWQEYVFMVRVYKK